MTNPKDGDVGKQPAAESYEAESIKVLKGLAEYLDMSLGDLLEGICLHAFEGRSAFSPETIEVIERLKGVYGLDLDASASHRMRER